jgi:hypothetical protein
MTALDLPLATLPSADFVPNSWPNSGFRNSGQRGAKGGILGMRPARVQPRPVSKCQAP